MKAFIGKNKRYTVLIALLILITAGLNLLSWNSRSFSDLYREHVFVLWGPLYGFVTSRTDRSVGEIMLFVAVILSVAAIFSLLYILITYIIKRISDRNGRKESGPPAHYAPNAFVLGYLKTFVAILAAVALVQTLNCFVLYHTSTFEEQYLEDMLRQKGNRRYTVDELWQLRDLVVERANELALRMDRDGSGNIVYDGDMAGKAVESMKALGEDYYGLSGYYGRPKALYTSAFFSQQYIMGYYFPFSMEANYNDVMYIANIPSTMCHELAHTKGYISEDEANLIGFLACIRSDDDLFKYSGYLMVLGYINKDIIDSIRTDVAAGYGMNVGSPDEITWGSLEAAGIDVEEYNNAVVKIYGSHTAISDMVENDRVFLTKEAWDEVEENAVLDTETVHAASDAFINANLKANGVSQGDAVYSEVVALLMDYYVYNIEEELQ